MNTTGSTGMNEERRETESIKVAIVWGMVLRAVSLRMTSDAAAEFAGSLYDLHKDLVSQIKLRDSQIASHLAVRLGESCDALISLLRHRGDHQMQRMQTEKMIKLFFEAIDATVAQGSEANAETDAKTNWRYEELVNHVNQLSAINLTLREDISYLQEDVAYLSAKWKQAK